MNYYREFIERYICKFTNKTRNFKTLIARLVWCWRNIYLAITLLYIMGKPTIISTHTQRLNVFEVNDPCIIQNKTSQNSDVPPRNVYMISDISCLPKVRFQLFSSRTKSILASEIYFFRRFSKEAKYPAKILFFSCLPIMPGDK